MWRRANAVIEKLMGIMSKEDKEMKTCPFDTESKTRIIAKLHRVKWTIENISLLVDRDEIFGPELYFMRTCLSQLSFCKVYNDLILIKLYNISNLPMKIIKGKLVLLDCNGRKLEEIKIQSEVLESRQWRSLMFKSSNDGKFQFNSLKDDKLVIDFCLKVVAHIKSNSFESETEDQNKLLNDLKFMFNNPDCSDFKLQVGDDVIYAHKVILSMRSVYFKRMFETEMTENVQNFVSVTDVTYPTLKSLIEFLYTGNFISTEECNYGQEVLNLYVAADKYQVLELRSLCANKLISNASVGNILEVLELAKRCNDDYLKFEAMNFVFFEFDEVIKSNNWKALLSNEVELASEVISFCIRT